MEKKHRTTWKSYIDKRGERESPSTHAKGKPSCRLPGQKIQMARMISRVSYVGSGITLAEVHCLNITPCLPKRPASSFAHWLTWIKDACNAQTGSITSYSHVTSATTKEQGIDHLPNGYMRVSLHYDMELRIMDGNLKSHQLSLVNRTVAFRGCKAFHNWCWIILDDPTHSSDSRIPLDIQYKVKLKFITSRRIVDASMVWKISIEEAHEGMKPCTT